MRVNEFIGETLFESHMQFEWHDNRLKSKQTMRMDWSMCMPSENQQFFAYIFAIRLGRC